MADGVGVGVALGDGDADKGVLVSRESFGRDLVVDCGGAAKSILFVEVKPEVES